MKAWSPNKDRSVREGGLDIRTVQKSSVSCQVCVTEKYFSYFSTKTYVVGTQKNRLNETVLLNIQNIC